jgi:pimeloyl-ACP methyl ester carboxylesterase
MPESYALINDLRYHYLYWNPDSPSRPLLLLHGLASNARIWEKVVPWLAQAGLRMYLPDLRGHGLSDHPDGDYGFDTFAADLARFIDLFALERPLLIGHSWGAMLALDYAARFAVGPRAPAGVILVDGAHFQLDDFPGATWEEMRQRLAPPRLAGMPLHALLERLQNVHPAWQPDPQDRQIILANFEITEEDTVLPHLSFENHMKIVAAMWDFKTYAHFNRLRCPALAVPAQPPPPLSPREAEFLPVKQAGLARIQQINPAVQVRWMQDSIHDIPLQSPEPLAQVILEFLEQLP